MKRYKKGEHIVASNMIFEIHGSYQWRDNLVMIFITMI
jgi:hypothetical protein